MNRGALPKTPQRQSCGAKSTFTTSSTIKTDFSRFARSDPRLYSRFQAGFAPQGPSPCLLTTYPERSMFLRSIGNSSMTDHGHLPSTSNSWLQRTVASWLDGPGGIRFDQDQQRNPS